MKVFLHSLGCARNLVDSEYMLGSLKKSGFEISDSLDGSDVAIVNTCSFIEDAKKESLEAIVSLIALKKTKKIRYVIVAGCLPQRYKQILLKKFPEIDAFIGIGDIGSIAGVIKDIAKAKSRDFVTKAFRYVNFEPSKRLITTPEHFTYIRIADGCSNCCSYCAIPNIRGPYRSRSIESIISEIKFLIQKKPFSEINLVGQDTTYYGYDLYGSLKITDLLRRIIKLKPAKWIRLLYAHPEHLSGELISLFKNEPLLVKYIDMPIQHISDKLLKKMNRETRKSDIIKLIDKLRNNIPGMAIRTTVMVGFPGETDVEFKELLAFIKEIKFERLGAFMYSKEDSTRAYKFANQIPLRVKQERLDEIMLAQQDIARERNLSLIGKTLEVLIDEKDKDLFIGRTQHDAPEVDNLVYVKAKGLKPGQFVKAKIVDAYEYDLVGEIASASPCSASQ